MSTAQRSGTTLGALPPLDQRRVDGGPAAQRVLEVGQHLGQAQQVARHRGDRVDAAIGLRPVRRRPVRGRRDPRATALGKPDREIARLPDDRGPLCQEPAFPQHLRAVDPRQLLVGRQVEGDPPRPARSRPGARRPRRRAPPRSGPSCRTRRVRSGARRSPRPRTDPPSRCRGIPPARCRGARSTRASARRRRRSWPRRSGVPPRHERPRGRRRAPRARRRRPRPPRPRCRRDSPNAPRAGSAPPPGPRRHRPRRRPGSDRWASGGDAITRISGTLGLRVARRARTMERCSISPPPSPRTSRPIHGLSRRRAIASRRCWRS